MSLKRNIRKTNQNVFPASDDFARVADWKQFQQVLEHNRVVPPGGQLQIGEVRGQFELLQQQFEALEDSCRQLRELARLRGDAISALEDVRDENKPARLYQLKAVLMKLNVQQCSFRSTWHQLYLQMHEAMRYVPKIGTTAFKEMLQHNIMCSQALLDESLEVEGQACNSKRLPAPEEFDGLIRQRYSDFLQRKRKDLGALAPV